MAPGGEGDAVAVVWRRHAAVPAAGRLSCTQPFASGAEPLSAMRRSAAAITHGDYTVAADETRQEDEVGETCRVFDAMRLRLQSVKAERQRYERRRKEMLAGIIGKNYLIASETFVPLKRCCIVRYLICTQQVLTMIHAVMNL